MSYSDHFEKNLKHFAKSKYKTLANLASELNILPQNLIKYTTGTLQPPGEFFYKLAQLRCDINWLLTGKSFDKASYENNVTTNEGNIVGSMEGNARNIINNSTELLKKENEFLKKENDSLKEQIKTNLLVF